MTLALVTRDRRAIGTIFEKEVVYNGRVHLLLLLLLLFFKLLLLVLQVLKVHLLLVELAVLKRLRREVERIMLGWRDLLII